MADRGLRVAAEMYVVIGLGVAGFALFAMSIDPATFQEVQIQMVTDPGRQADCAATAAEAAAMRGDAALLLLWGSVLALAAITAVVVPSRFNTINMQFLGAAMAMKLADVLTGVLHVTIGRCFDHGSYHRALCFGYAMVAVHSFTLFFYTLGIDPFSKVDLGSALKYFGY